MEFIKGSLYITGIDGILPSQHAKLATELRNKLDQVWDEIEADWDVVIGVSIRSGNDQ